MVLRNCPECKRLFTGGQHDICMDCKKKEEEEYDKVSVYLKKNPKRSIDDVVEQTEVPRKKIIKFLKEGKILGADITTGELLLTCSSCGKPINEGKICKECAEALSQKLKGSQQKQTPQTPKAMPGDKISGQMHTLERIMKKRDERK